MRDRELLFEWYRDSSVVTADELSTARYLEN
jgi:hypothetical protein